MVYAYNKTLFILQKKWNPDSCYNMNESWYHSKSKKPDTKECILQDAIMKCAG